MNKRYLVFDVESVGLHGQAFAVGFVVVDEFGNGYESGRFACPPSEAWGTDESRAWIKANVPPIEAAYESPLLVRGAFWDVWMKWKAEGAVLVADCAWPVEARFLIECVEDYPHTREWDGPYPLHDLASVALSQGKDPLKTHDRLPNELPAHDPLNDAMQSARLWVELLSY